jgi:transposase InsO family protein
MAPEGCGVLRAERSSYHYRGRRADQAELKKRMREVAETRVRYGYRRIHVLLRREGWDVNAKRIYRLYKEIHPWRHARLQPAGQADRQRIYRVFQWDAAG